MLESVTPTPLICDNTLEDIHSAPWSFHKRITFLPSLSISSPQSFYLAEMEPFRILFSVAYS
jgi:hypothetical protein